jgi:hypothetical protein
VLAAAGQRRAEGERNLFVSIRRTLDLIPPAKFNKTKNGMRMNADLTDFRGWDRRIVKALAARSQIRENPRPILLFFSNRQKHRSGGPLTRGY